MYCKAGGYPWSPHGLTQGTCYVGIGFYRPLGSRFPTMQTSLVQAFDEHGEGLVLRGHDFDWDPDKTGSRSPHLTADDAARLMDQGPGPVRAAHAPDPGPRRRPQDVPVLAR